MKLYQVALLPVLVGLAQGAPFPGSVISLGSGRVDVFFAAQGEIFHKYHANPAAGWNQGFEALNQSVAENIYPAATTLGDNQLHVFVNAKGSLKHKFWDGYQWLPSDGWETLGSGLAEDSNLAVTNRGKNRLHIVGKAVDGSYVHKYYDGSAWKPDGNKDLESLGSDGFGKEKFAPFPAINSWGSDRLDIFGALTNGTLLHKYWDGYQWKPSASSWEQWGDGFQQDPKVTSWGESRLDVWGVRAVSKSKDTLSHRYWDGYSLSEWEEHASLSISSPSITHWAPNRIDVFVSRNFPTQYLHKYYDGSQWNPSPDNSKWSNHGPYSFTPDSAPAAVSWSANNLNVFAIDTEGKLLWQLWEGSQWLPSVGDFYDLGAPPQKSTGKTVIDKVVVDNSFQVQTGDQSLDL